jgi:hypothetical protein
MRLGSKLLAAVALILACAATPALAGWKLIQAGRPFAVNAITLMPTSDWNRAGGRLGKYGVALTHDGFGLDALEIFSGVAPGDPLYRKRSTKRYPVPTFERGMLLPDLAQLFERSFRMEHQLTDFTVEKVVPADFGGHRGLSLRYRYSLPQDNLSRLGAARMAVVGGRLYVANFHAPRLHYFPSRIAEIETMLESARFSSGG